MKAFRVVGILIVIAAALLGLASWRERTWKADHEVFAWERTPQGHYKQVKKNYYMDDKLCENVIDVLNDMSTTKPRSNWILSQTTDSTFECWPARIDPNQYYRKYSGQSDQPNSSEDPARK